MAESVNTSGLYSLVRNPLYWGNGLIFAGLLIVFANPWALTLFAVFLFLQYHFIVLAEESYLRERHGAAYLEYCGRVRRWLPRPALWTAPTGRFDWRKVLLKENDSAFNLLLALLLILAWKERHFAGNVRHPFWLAGAAALLFIAYAGVKTAKKGWLKPDK